MIVKLLRDNGRNPFKNAILSECLLERGRISIFMPYAYIEVPEWTVFCNCVIRAAAACSRDNRGSYLKGGINVHVALESGREFNVHIDVVAYLNALRYGAIYA